MLTTKFQKAAHMEIPIDRIYTDLCYVTYTFVIHNHLFHSFIFLEFFEHATFVSLQYVCNICHLSNTEDVPNCPDFSKKMGRGAGAMSASSLG